MHGENEGVTEIKSRVEGILSMLLWIRDENSMGGRISKELMPFTWGLWHTKQNMLQHKQIWGES